MPTDYELYYGFTRFAVELNELCPEMRELLPPTDARYRPDQRYTQTHTHTSKLVCTHFDTHWAFQKEFGSVVIFLFLNIQNPTFKLSDGK